MILSWHLICLQVRMRGDTGEYVSNYQRLTLTNRRLLASLIVSFIPTSMKSTSQLLDCFNPRTSMLDSSLSMLRCCSRFVSFRGIFCASCICHVLVIASLQHPTLTSSPTCGASYGLHYDAGQGRSASTSSIRRGARCLVRYSNSNPPEFIHIRSIRAVCALCMTAGPCLRASVLAVHPSFEVGCVDLMVIFNIDSSSPYKTSS
jgi:hypothetical protein